MWNITAIIALHRRLPAIVRDDALWRNGLARLAQEAEGAGGLRRAASTSCRPRQLFSLPHCPERFQGAAGKKRAINSMLDVEMVLTTIVAKAVQLR
jgi:hypothetical protein